MLDGLLGRSGFYTKCKSLIKQTRTRIDVVKRKRNATNKFLRKDIADLLANGLDSNAYGRAEGLVTELILSSCYDFIDHVCEIILKHLPVLQKLRDCPEDCREAVASLMYAAARFSDLPELRELRDLFQERYGSSIEYYVNQKLVENITPKPPTMEKKVQLMREIATEFSIWWDSKGFEERLSNPSANEKNKRRSPVTAHPIEHKVVAPSNEEAIHKIIKKEEVVKRSEATSRNKERVAVDRHQRDVERDNHLKRRDDLKHNVSRGSEMVTDRYKSPSFKDDVTIQKKEHVVSYQRRGSRPEVQTEMLRDDPLVKSDDLKHNVSRGSELIAGKYESPSYKNETIQKREEHSIPYKTRGTIPEVHESKENGTSEAEPVPVKRDDGVDGLKPNFRSAIPPPYVKPKKNKHKTDDNEPVRFTEVYHKHKANKNNEEETITFNPGSNNDKSESNKLDTADEPVRFTEIYYKDASSCEITPKRRSQRRKHSRSLSSKDEKGVNGELGTDGERVVRQVSTSRRKHESRKGLQILFDDDHHKDSEEKMIDKLLLHYSKKPSSGDPGKPKRKSTNDEMNGKSKPSHQKAEDVEDQNSTPSTSRSFSLPPRHVIETEPPKKVFTRAASFQPDTPAKHVHPKLPNYDDLAARFAALRSGRD